MTDGSADRAPETRKSPDEEHPPTSRTSQHGGALAAARIAFGWGFAEATFFFIVPDVFLTRVALTNLPRALWLSMVSVAGALIGGSLLWFIVAQGGATSVFHFFAWLPGISDQLIWRVGQEISHRGASALLLGALHGQPLKLFVACGGVLKVPFGQFIAYAALARTGRFWATAILASACGRLLQGTSVKLRHQLHVLFWIAFYAVYFVVMR